MSRRGILEFRRGRREGKPRRWLARVAAPLPALLALLAPASGLADAGPRAFAWGASPEAVIAAESAELIVRMPEQLIYHAQFTGLEAVLTYHFPEGRLTQARYLNRERHADRVQFIRDFERVREILSDRHGEPRHEAVDWRNDLFRAHPERHGDAVAAGHLAYYTHWRTAGTGIAMTLRSDRLQVAHEIVYTDAATGEAAATP